MLNVNSQISENILENEDYLHKTWQFTIRIILPFKHFTEIGG
jgi:hypothetical protein